MRLAIIRKRRGRRP